MHRVQILLAFAAAALASTAHASETVDQIRALVSSSITLHSIEEKSGYVELSGTAPDNTEIAALMRAVDDARLGDPQLESIMRENGVSLFQLRVRLKQ